MNRVQKWYVTYNVTCHTIFGYISHVIVTRNKLKETAESRIAD